MIQLSALLSTQPHAAVRAGPLAATGASSFALSLDAMAGPLRVGLTVKAAPDAPAASRQPLAEAGKELPETLLASEDGEGKAEDGAPADDEGPSPDTDPRDPTLVWLPGPILPSVTVPMAASLSAPATGAAPIAGVAAEMPEAEAPHIPGPAQAPRDSGVVEEAAINPTPAADRRVLVARDTAGAPSARAPASPAPEAIEVRAPDAPPARHPGVPAPALASAPLGPDAVATRNDATPILLPAAEQPGSQVRGSSAASAALILQAPRPMPAPRFVPPAGIEIEAPIDAAPPTSLPEATDRLADPRIEEGQRGAPRVRMASAPVPSPVRTVTLQPGVQVIQEALVAAFAPVDAPLARAAPPEPGAPALVAVGGAAHPPQIQPAGAMGDAQQGALDMRRQEWMGQMVERIEAMREASPGGDTRIRLAPDLLGNVDVSIRHEGDRIHVHFAAETAAARQMLSEAQPRLAELAEARGIRLGQTSVDGGGAGQGSQGQRQDAAPGQPARPTPAQADSKLATDPADQRVA